MKEKVNEEKKVGRPHPKTAVVEEAKGYERTYEGFFDWLRDKHVETSDLPMFLMREYANIENIRKTSKSHVVNEALGHALRKIRVAIFDDIKAFLDYGFKYKVETGSMSWKESFRYPVRYPGFHEFMKRQLDQSMGGEQLKRHDAAVKANATRKAMKKGGAK